MFKIRLAAYSLITPYPISFSHRFAPLMMSVIKVCSIQLSFTEFSLPARHLWYAFLFLCVCSKQLEPTHFGFVFEFVSPLLNIVLRCVFFLLYCRENQPKVCS